MKEPHMAQTENIFDRETLLAAARGAAKQAYAPYSRFRVGAAVVVTTASGPRIVAGANVENASYGLALCAERSALSSACALLDADRPNDPSSRLATSPRVTHIAIACVDAAPDAPANERMPCGACRQWFAELAPDATFFIEGVSGSLTLADLLPNPFLLRPDRSTPADQ